MPAPSRSFTARHVQLSRAVLAAVAAVMITFSPDHSPAIGLAVFGGFAVVTSLLLVAAAVVVYGAGRRWPAVLIAAISLLAGMAASVPAWRNETVFFVLVIAWAALSGLVEVLAGLRLRGTDGARDAVIVGVLGLLLAVVLGLVIVVSAGIVIGVGMFGGYAAIVAVFLGIAGLTPRARAVADTSADAGADRLADHGGQA